MKSGWQKKRIVGRADFVCIFSCKCGSQGKANGSAERR